jgi:phosphoglycerol transferase
VRDRSFERLGAWAVSLRGRWRLRRVGPLTWLLLLVLFGLIAGSAFLRAYFGPVTPDQLGFHLRHGGLEYADPRFAWRAVRWGLGVAFLVGASALLLACMGRRGRQAMWALLGTWAAASVTATVTDPCRPEPGVADPLQRHYVDPASQRYGRAPGLEPDVLVVFVESLDQSYARPDAPDASDIPRLSALQREAQTFGALHNLSGANWTVGGIFTALCGVPLGRIGLMSTHALEYSPRFFQGGTCLTDLLVAQGWEASFYGGASLRFAGKGQFLSDHGVARRFGREQWQALGVPVPAAGWGLLDSELVEQAWRDMNRPRTGQAPRLSLLLTVNTHGPSGSSDPGCTAADAAGAGEDDLDEAGDLFGQDPEDPASVSGVARMRAALRCSDVAVTRLVERFVARRDGRPKVVWVMGDHLTPKPLQEQGLPPPASPRTVYHALLRIDASGRPLPASAAQRRFTHADVMPTLADAAGLRWGPHAHRLGVGVSLLHPQGAATLAERMGFERMDGVLSCPSPLFERLWMGLHAPHRGQ